MSKTILVSSRTEEKLHNICYYEILLRFVRQSNSCDVLLWPCEYIGGVQSKLMQLPFHLNLTSQALMLHVLPCLSRALANNLHALLLKLTLTKAEILRDPSSCFLFVPPWFGELLSSLAIIHSGLHSFCHFI